MQEAVVTNNSRQAAWIALGNFCSFLIGIVTPMILSRYFTKADYGTYKQVIYVYDTLLVVFTLGLPRTYSYYLPKRPLNQSKQIIQKITNILFVLGVTFSLVLFWGATPISKLLKNDDLVIALRLFSPTPLFLLPTLGLEGIYAAYKKTQYVALYSVGTRVFTIVCIVLPVVVFNGTYLHAVLGFVVASFISFLLAMYMKTAPVKNQPKDNTDIKYKDILRFSLPLFYASIWGLIVSSSNQFFISRYYGNAVFADYSNGFIQNPLVGMVVGGVSVILLPVFSALNKDNNEKDLKSTLSVWQSSLIKSSKFVFPILVFSIVFANLLMICMYGNLYSDSAIYFQVRNASALLQIIPFAPIILAIGKTREYANVHLFYAILVVLFEYVAVILINNPIAVAIVSEICRIISILLQINIIARHFNLKISSLFPTRVLGKVLLVSLLAAIIPSLFVPILSLNKFVLLFVCLVLYVASFYLLCWPFKLSYKEIAASFLKSPRLSFLFKLIP